MTQVDPKAAARGLSAAEPAAAAGAQGDPSAGEPAKDIRNHLLFRLSLYTTIAERNGKLYFQDRFGLTLREYRVLGVIGYAGPISVVGLANECFLDKGQVSRVSGKLVDAGYVCRRAEVGTGGDVIDRGGQLCLTDEGRALLDQALDYGDMLNLRALSVLSEDEIAVFSENLERITARAKELFHKNNG